MSQLAIMLDQIQRPSFLPNYSPPSRRPSQPTADAKRADVLECLTLAGRPVGRGWVEDYTGFTKQSINHLLNALVDEGKAKRIPGGSVLLWEVVKVEGETP